MYTNNYSNTERFDKVIAKITWCSKKGALDRQQTFGAILLPVGGSITACHLLLCV